MSSNRYKWKVLKSFESSKISQLITDFEISQKNDLTIGPIKQIMTGFKKAYDNTLSSQIRNFKKGTRLYLKRFSEKRTASVNPKSWDILTYILRHHSISRVGLNYAA